MDIKTSRLDASNPLVQQLTSNIHQGLAQLPAHARAALIADSLSPATVKPAPALHAISHCEPATMEQLTQSIKAKRRQLVRSYARPQRQFPRAARALPWQWQLRTLASRMARQVKKAWTRAMRMPAHR